MFPDRLLAGYRAFLDDRLPKERARFETLAERGQSPEIMVIGCCDSRVSPEVIFDANPGELFVVRNVANLVPPFETGGEYHGTSAALEFAVQALKVKHIVILGHARCGGVAAFAGAGAPLSPGDFIGRWVSLIAPAAERLGQPGAAPGGSIPPPQPPTVQRRPANLLPFPFVKILVERGRFPLPGAYSGVAPGPLLTRAPEPGAFGPAVGALPRRASRVVCR